ncbi:MAG: DUF6476 family protein [Proteobacteria bacterium]|jgi:hypothetical protein|nr:DUF6476 family protein [Pseudomonadota bacterium]
MNKISDEEPANLKFLRILVTILTTVMIVGLIIVITLLVVKLQPSKIQLPQDIVLPKGTKAMSYSQGIDWYAVTTSDNKIMIFDGVNGTIRQEISIDTKSE